MRWPRRSHAHAATDPALTSVEIAARKALLPGAFLRRSSSGNDVRTQKGQASLPGLCCAGAEGGTQQQMRHFFQVVDCTKKQLRCGAELAHSDGTFQLRREQLKERANHETSAVTASY